MHRKNDPHVIDIFFVLATALTTVFLSLLLIAAGVGVYRRVLANTQESYALRTPAAYITQKVRRYAEEGAVYTGRLTDVPALILEEEIDGRTYVTYLYASDGFLRELFTEKENTGFSPEAGSAVTPLKSLSFEMLGDAVRFDLTGEGEGAASSFLLHLQGAKKEVSDEK